MPPAANEIPSHRYPGCCSFVEQAHSTHPTGRCSFQNSGFIHFVSELSAGFIGSSFTHTTVRRRHNLLFHQVILLTPPTPAHVWHPNCGYRAASPSTTRA